MLRWELQGRVLRRSRAQHRLVIQVDMNSDAAAFYQRWLTLWLVLLRLLQWALPLFWQLASFASDASLELSRPRAMIRVIWSYSTTLVALLAIWFASLFLASLANQLAVYLTLTLPGFFIK